MSVFVCCVLSVFVFGLCLVGFECLVFSWFVVCVSFAYVCVCVFFASCFEFRGWCSRVQAVFVFFVLCSVCVVYHLPRTSFSNGRTKQNIGLYFCFRVLP